MRKEISMNQGWLFAKTTEPPKTLPTDWEAVDLPHTWNAVDGQDGGNDYWRGTAMYCKAFPKPELEAGGKAFLEINVTQQEEESRLKRQLTQNQRRIQYRGCVRKWHETGTPRGWVFHVPPGYYKQLGGRKPSLHFRG